ncbi:MULTISPECIES: hypothetical protein [unclassified Hahella]|uniref:hypothetical protein n=1 Tax=unclassified Hahella TaxID=2624107 RepID=UPI001C1EF3FA|nr:MULTISPECIES: hypothetical protein [unclassified Hahella]MBU6953332.1 hypothetical protein [Hahella sp. HN01]MDG9669388.1 hypothetical protein [Hahella sp. CR1]WLQ16459.1 hypothetical protein O5O45_11060 [Hahella sp. HNIBRBA332]
MSDVITGMFKVPTNASAAIHMLEYKGIKSDDISLVTNSNFTKDSFALTEHSKLPEGVAVGATTGGVLAAVAGGLTAVGAVATAGAGLLAAGPFVAALAAGGAGGAVGGLIGGAIGLAIPEHEIKYYEDAIKKGAVLVGVRYTSDTKDMIKDVFKQFDADKIATA